MQAYLIAWEGVDQDDQDAEIWSVIDMCLVLHHDCT